MIVDVDVVIPTLGGPSLSKVILKLNKGYFRPRNIICVTYKNNLNNIRQIKNVKIINSFTKNQVYQRNLGFKYVTSKFVMQLDDDVYFTKNTLKKLYLAIKSKTGKNVIGPVYQLKKKDINTKKVFLNFLKNIYHFIICGSHWGDRKYGTITKLTISFTIINNFKNFFLIETEWLPGGCIIFNKKLLSLTFDKFNFKGKSFCEDIFFSIQRRKKNIKHYVLNSAFADHKPTLDLNLKSFFNEMKIRYNLLSSGSLIKIRFFFWAFLEIILRLIKKIKISLFFIKNKI